MGAATSKTSVVPSPSVSNGQSSLPKYEPIWGGGGGVRGVVNPEAKEGDCEQVGNPAPPPAAHSGPHGPERFCQTEFSTDFSGPSPALSLSPFRLIPLRCPTCSPWRLWATLTAPSFLSWKAMTFPRCLNRGAPERKRRCPPRKNMEETE